MADTYTQVKDIKVNITVAAVAGSIGLGIPLVIQGKAGDDKEYQEVSSLTEVVDAGFDTASEIYKACAAIFGQDNQPEKVAIATTTEKVADWLTANLIQGFRQIIPVLGTDDSTLDELATLVNTTDDKMLFLAVASKDKLPTLQSERIVAIVYGGVSEYPNAAVVGASAGLTAGSFTYKNLILRGIESEVLTPTQVEEIHTAGGICILRKAGDIVTSEGKTTDGEYIDIVDSKDYIIRNIVYQGQKLLNDNKKLSFDNVGIAQLENVVTGVLADHMGHLMGHQFEGSGGIENVVAMDSKLNQGDYAKLEKTLASAVKNGADVKLKVEPIYGEKSYRPSEFRVSYSINGEKEVVLFKNGSGN